MDDYQRNSFIRRKDCRFQEFKISLSKPIIDEIDKVLARHYGFTNEELDYIIMVRSPAFCSIFNPATTLLLRHPIANCFISEPLSPTPITWATLPMAATLCSAKKYAGQRSLSGVATYRFRYRTPLIIVNGF